MVCALSRSTDFRQVNGSCSITCKSSCTFFIAKNASSTAWKTCGGTPPVWRGSRPKRDAKILARPYYFFCGVADGAAAGAVDVFLAGVGGAAADGVEGSFPDAPGVGDGRPVSGVLMLISSTSKTRVEFGPI